MQRYTVTIVSAGAPGERPTLMVPFQPNAVVLAFIEELFRRVAKQGLSLSPNTHLATLHLDSETGAIIDCEDVLSDVVRENDQLFAVFKQKNGGGETDMINAAPQSAACGISNSTTDSSGMITVRVITPASARSGQSSTIKVSPKATIRELHQAIADHLGVPANVGDEDGNECNCNLARKLADGPSPPGQFLVVHDHSKVERFDLQTASETALKEVLRGKFGAEIETKKKVNLLGAEVDDVQIYKKTPVVAICSKIRHIPAHAKLQEVDETGVHQRILDLHTSETPINPASMDATLETARLADLAVDGILDIYAVQRLVDSSSSGASAAGKSSIYRAKAHWDVAGFPQSARGKAMLLSSLRVFAHLVQEMDDDERAQDSVLHTFDLLTNFPPAVRTMYILINGRTPCSSEVAALSSTLFELLDNFMPTTIIGTTRTRVFEGARLLFGFVLEKARTVKLAESTGQFMPYLSAFETVGLQGCITSESVMHVVQTTEGHVEKTLYEAFEEGALLAQSHLKPIFVKLPVVDVSLVRVALLNAGQSAQVVKFGAAALKANYQYADGGNVNSALDLEELNELHHLAELCGRNKLAVHKPSQLASAVAPALTFDRKAHLAVYTGEQPCGDPGRSSLQFRPIHGEETIDSAVVEQLIAPILQTYEADGTAVFDALGGAAVRRLQSPDECLMFVVDCSASMRQRTDFEECNDEAMDPAASETTAESLVEAEAFNVSLDKVKEMLCQYESFETDMVAIVAGSANFGQQAAARAVIEVLRTLLATDIVNKHKEIEKRQARGAAMYYARQELAAMQKALQAKASFWAGLKTHEDAISDFLVYRANTASPALTQKWTWALGDAVPAVSPPNLIPKLSADITDVPDELRCPISYVLMEDAVKATDGKVYSRDAIDKWFNIRSSSPMLGVQLQDLTLMPDDGVSQAVAAFINGDDLGGSDQPAAKRLRPRPNDYINIVFESSAGSFDRKILKTSSMSDLYKVAFRGLKAKHSIFQLTKNDAPLRPSAISVSATGLHDGDRLAIRIAEDAPTALVSQNAVATAGESNELALIKVYDTADRMLFGFWVRRDTPLSLACIIWKYWRYQARTYGLLWTTEKQVWTDMKDSGDGLLSGSPQQSTDNLSKYLSAMHCFGKLGQEKVFRERNLVDLDLFSGRTTSGSKPLVLKVWVSGPWRQRQERAKLTRLDVLKQMFEALINRMLAYNFKTHVGLITVGSTAQVTMPISHVLENFRRSTTDMVAQGDTALWDALNLAKDQLSEYGTRYPNAKKRIICISDGLDTKSQNNNSQEVCWQLRNASVVTDTVSLGEEENLELKTIAYLLGGYRLHPTSLANALAICEMEPFLSITERPTISPPADTPNSRLRFLSHFWNARYIVNDTTVTNDRVPPRKEHPNLRDGFVQLTAAAGRPQNANNVEGSLPSNRSNLRTTRLLNEMRQLVAAGPHAQYDIYVSETDMSFWKIVMSGPDGSPYAEGTFMLYLHADEGYPTFGPKARFTTKIKHPNVNAHGRICHSIFDRDWTSDTSMSTLLDTIFGLLYQPETSDPVNTTSTLSFHHDQIEFEEEVRDYTARHAAKTREQWKDELLGGWQDDEEDEDDDEGEDGEDDNEDEDEDEIELVGDRIDSDDMDEDEFDGVSSELGDELE